MSTARRGGVDELELISVSGEIVKILAGDDDPTTAGGVPATEGSLYLRDQDTDGELWLKTGAADTAWTAVPLAASGTEFRALPEKWHQADVAASQTNVDLSALVSVSFDTIKAVRAGSIVGLSTRFTQAITDATASSAVVTVTVNGTPGTLSVSHDSGTNPSGGESTQASGIDTYVAGDLLGIEITTLGTFAPTTTDIEAWMDIAV